MTIKISGHSDDIVCFAVEGEAGEVTEDEVGSTCQDVAFVIGDEVTKAGVVVTMLYAAESSPRRDGVWTAQVQQIGDGGKVPWSVRFETDPATANDYTVTVVVDCPPGTPFTVVRRGERQRAWDTYGTFSGGRFERRR